MNIVKFKEQNCNNFAILKKLSYFALATTFLFPKTFAQEFDYSQIIPSPSEFTTSKDIKFEEIDYSTYWKNRKSTAFKINLPDGEKYYQYTYDSAINTPDNKVWIDYNGWHVNTPYPLINNTSPIDILEGDFVGNRGIEKVIRNESSIDNIEVSFVGNRFADYYSALNEDQTNFLISNRGSINNISGKFLGNGFHDDYGEFDTDSAIGNNGTIKSITADFIGNDIRGVYNGSNGKIGDISGNFIGNGTGYSNSFIENKGEIENIIGDFAYSRSQISNSGKIKNIKGNFINNSVITNEANNIIYNRGEIDSLSGTFISNKVLDDYLNYGADGAVIHNKGSIKEIKDSLFKDNGIEITTTKDAGANLNTGGVISNTFSYYATEEEKAKLKEISLKGDNAFISNHVSTVSTDALGGAVYNEGRLNLNLDNSNVVFQDNFVNCEGQNDKKAQGGAVYSNNDLAFKLNNSTLLFKGNYTKNADVTDDNAIYMTNDTKSNLEFDLKNNSNVQLYDNIRGGEQGYNVKITGDKSGVFGLYNSMHNASLEAGDVTISTVDNKVYSYQNNDSYHFKDFTLKSDVKMVADVDLKNSKMDRFTSDNYGDHQNNTLEVIGLNLLSDTEDNETAVYFAQNGLKDNVKWGGGLLPDGNQNYEAFTPIYKYNVRYDKRADGGYFVFNRGNSKSHNTYNPAVLSANVFSQAGANVAINETFKYAFEHLDAFTQLPLHKRLSEINKNKYAISTDYNYNLGSLNPEHNKAGWLRPYSIFESIPLKNGPKVDVISYGSLFGYDGEFKQRKNGINSIGTIYLGYSGSSLKYNNVDTTMNGGLIGFTETFYRKNLWSATTLTVGANNGISHNMYGREDFNSLFAGIGQKMGYNFEFRDGKYIIQPMLFLSYSFINTFDYTNSANVKIKADPAHTFQINPNIRFIANLKNGFQPYLSVGMVWNPLSESCYSANGIKLPEMSIKPYVEYDVGIQRNWSDKFTMFFQTMIRNGGRNGVALTAGFRWAIGKDYKNEKL